MQQNHEKTIKLTKIQSYFYLTHWSVLKQTYIDTHKLIYTHREILALAEATNFSKLSQINDESVYRITIDS